MDFIELLKVDLSKGFSKKQLEELIGLPKNNLSSILKGERKLSKISMLKIEKWDNSEKPNPLDLIEPRKGGLKVFVPTNQPVLDKFGKVLVSEKAVKKESNCIDEMKKRFPIEEIPRLKGESSIEYRLRMIELLETKNTK